MQNIQIEILPQTEENKLYPQYDHDAQILEVSSKSQRPWPYGVDIDGVIIFDLDANRVLANFDLLIPKRLWREVPEIKPQSSMRRGDLVFSTNSIRQKSFHLPIKVTTDSMGSLIVIHFGEASSKISAISLSERCFALVDENVLFGFFIRLQ